VIRRYYHGSQVLDPAGNKVHNSIIVSSATQLFAPILVKALGHKVHTNCIITTQPPSQLFALFGVKWDINFSLSNHLQGFLLSNRARKGKSLRVAKTISRGLLSRPSRRPRSALLSLYYHKNGFA